MVKVFLWGESRLRDLVEEFFNNHESDGLVYTPMEADYHISCQYGKIFTKDQIDKYGYILNIHFSDTRVLRGCNVMSHAIEQGFEYTKITFHVIDEGIDTGPLLMGVRVPIYDEDTAYTLYERCTEYAFSSFCEYWDGFFKKKPKGCVLDTIGTYYPRELDRELKLTEEQKRFIRSRTFPGKPRPFVVVGGREIEL